MTLKVTLLLNTETSNGLSLELLPVDDMVTVQSKWEQRFISSVDTIQRKFIFSIIYPVSSSNKLSYIEIWENTGDLINPNYQGELLDNSDGHEFFTYDYGEIIRINHDQCEVSNP